MGAGDAVLALVGASAATEELLPTVFSVSVEAELLVEIEIAAFAVVVVGCVTS